MKKIDEIELYRIITVKFLPATNKRKARVKLTEKKDGFNIYKTVSKTLQYKINEGGHIEQAYNYLLQQGFNVTGRAYNTKEFYFICERNLNNTINNYKEKRYKNPTI